MRFINAVEKHKEHPETFECPDTSNIWVGDSVKVGIYLEESVPGLNVDAERFWVTLTKISGDSLKGIVDNQLIFIPLAYQEEIEFSRENILTV